MYISRGYGNGTWLDFTAKAVGVLPDMGEAGHLEDFPTSPMLTYIPSTFKEYYVQQLQPKMAKQLT
jgi:hypothetical protein